MTEKQSDAVLQMEFRRKRMNAATINYKHEAVSISSLAWAIARGRLNDTITNGGTFVVVADGELLTIVQRTTVEKI